MALAQGTVTMSLMSVPPAGKRKPLVLNQKRANTQRPVGSSRLVVRASASSPGKEQVVAGLTAAALAAALLVPEVAEAAQPGLSPSLKNFLLSIVAGGVVLTALFGAVIGVANFDPVKRS
ncbi:putative photosystem II PsbX [Dioscorea sansibarensis]